MARKKAEPGNGDQAPAANGDGARNEAAGWGAEIPPEAVDAEPSAAPEPAERPEGLERPFSDPGDPASRDPGAFAPAAPPEPAPAASLEPPVEGRGDLAAEPPTGAEHVEGEAAPRPWETAPSARAGETGLVVPASVPTEPVEPADPWVRAEDPARTPLPDAPSPDAPPPDMPLADAQAEGEGVEEEHGWSFAAKALTALLLLLIGAGLALWGAPRLAPHLPAGMAPVAAWLSAGAAQTEARLAALDGRLDSELAALRAELEGLPSAEALRGEAEGVAARTRENLSGEIAALRARLDRAGDPAERFGRVETAISGVTAELATLRGQIEGGAGSAGAAEIDTYRAELDGLRAEVGRLSGEVSSLGERLTQAQQDLAERASAAEASAEQVKAEAEAARDLAAAQASLARIRAALVSGAPFQPELDRFAQASGASIPAGLSAAAASGVATMDALEAEFAPLAHAAIRSSIVAASDEGFWDRARAFVSAQVASRSLAPTQGSSPDAVLSRVEAALRGGDLQTALSEAEALPSEAKAAMADWFAAAQLRADAEAGLAELSAAPNMN